MAARTGPTCGADRRNDMGACKQPAGWHTDHPGFGRCSWHGGNAPNAVRAAARHAAQEAAQAELAKMDVAPVHDPLTALQRLAGQAEAWKESCARLVNKLTDVRYEGTLHGEQLRAEVGMFENSMRQSAAILTALSKLGLDERLVRIEEGKAAMLAEAFRASLALAALAPELDRAVRTDFARRLHALSRRENGDDPGDGAISGVVLSRSR